MVIFNDEIIFCFVKIAFATNLPNCSCFSQLLNKDVESILIILKCDRIKLMQDGETVQYMLMQIE